MNKKSQNTLFRIRGISEKQQLPDSQRVRQRVHSDPTGWPSELRRRNQKRNAPGSNPTGDRLSLGTQPRYEAPGDLWVKM